MASSPPGDWRTSLGHGPAPQGGSLSSSAVPPVRAGPEEMRCVGSKRTPEVGRDMLLAASIVKFSGAKAPGGNRTVPAAARALLADVLQRMKMFDGMLNLTFLLYR